MEFNTDFDNFITPIQENNPCVDGGISLDEYSRNVCSQLNHHIIKIGIIIVVLYVLITWGCWWFFNKGYKKLNSDYWNELDNRLYWDIKIKHHFMKFCVAYIVLILMLFS